MTERKKKEDLDEFISQSFAPFRDTPAGPVERAWHRVLELSRNASADAGDNHTSGAYRFRHRFLFVAAGLVVIILISASLLRDTFLKRAETMATDQTTHRSFAAGEGVRTDQSNGAMLSLADGSTVEMHPKSELLVERVQDGVRIRLLEGAVLLNVAKQRQGHLYVESKHVKVSVTGTILMVEVEAAGTRVAVIEGEVLVEYANVQKKLHGGEQAETSPLLVTKSLRESIAWSRSAEAYLTFFEEPARVEIPPPASVAPATQAATKLSFEAFSIRPTPPERVNRLQYERCPAGGRFVAAGLPLMWIIRYGFQVQDREITGAPDWTNEFASGFDIEAKPERPVSDEECRAMVRSMLEERFHLRTHRKTREASVFALVRGKDKLKLREVTTDDPPGGVRINGAVMQSVSEPQAPAGWSIRTLIGYISGFTGRRVIDKTGLQGLYAFSLDFAINEGDTSQGVFGAVQEQLGLKLEPSKEKVEFLVIDQVERPTPN